MRGVLLAAPNPDDGRFMKIVHKIMVANFVNILLIALTGFFAYRSLDQVLTKLRFMEIADDLNSSFLEMRLAEKNYFLYGDRSALPGNRKENKRGL